MSTPTIEDAVLALARRVDVKDGGFQGSDLEYGHRLAGRIALGQPLPDAHRRAAYRMLGRYVRHLRELGIELRDVTPPGEAPKAPPAKPTRGVIVRGDRIFTRTPFGDKDRMSVMPGAAWHKTSSCRQCNAQRGSTCKFPRIDGWHLPATPIGALNWHSTFETLGGYTADAAFRELLEQGLQGRAAGARRTADSLPPIPGLKTDAWLHQRQAYWFGAAQDGVLLDMEMGCVIGDAEVVVNRGGNSQRMTVAELHHKFHGGTSPAGRVKSLRTWRSDLPTRIRGLKADGTIGLVTLVATLDKGMQPTVLVTLKSGRSLRCTPDHEVLTADHRKVWAETLQPGDSILADEIGGRGWTPEQARTRSGRTTAKRQRQHGTDRGGYVWLHQPDHPNANANGTVLEHVVVMSRVLGRPLVAPECVHHVSGDTADNRPENLLLCRDQAEHARYHDWRTNLAGSLPVLDTVVSVTPAGEAQVFDVSVDDPAHTWVADGVVVGNTGKSLVAVGLMVAKHAEQPAGFGAIILCPDRVVGVWGKQFRIHAEQEWHVLDGRRENRNGETVFRPVADRVREFDHGLHECDCGLPHVVVANYAITIHEPFTSWALQQQWGAATFDEIHKLKSAGGKWSRWAAKLTHHAGFRAGLTGTLMPHSPLDVFGPARALEPGLFGTSETRFKHRYAIMGGYQNKQVMGIQPDREGELTDLIAQITYRVGDEVLDLPDEVPDVTLECTLSPPARRVYQAVESEMYAEVARLLASGASAEDAITADNVLVQRLRLQQITGGAVRLDSGVDVEIDTSKAELLEDVLEDIDPELPVVVFGKYHHDLDAIARTAGKLNRAYAELSGRRDDALTRDSTLSEANRDGEPLRIAGVQIQAGGTGVDLVRSHHAIYYSLGYSLGDYLQSRKRLRRPGQLHAVRYIHLVASGTIDTGIYDALAARESVAKHLGRLVQERIAAGDMPKAPRQPSDLQITAAADALTMFGADLL